MKTESQAYWNGQWVSPGEISIPLDDLGFLMGITVVERLRTFGGELFRYEKHILRLLQSLKIMGWDAQTLGREIGDALLEFTEKNSSAIAPGDDWSVVAFVTAGNSADCSQPNVCVHGHPLPVKNWANQFETGIDAVVVDVRQVPQNCWPSELKCRSRMHYYLADREAGKKQPGARAILLDQDGMIGEGSTANVVAYFADRGLVTPKRSKVLPGVSQEVLYELAMSLRIPHCEVDLSPSVLAQADELYFVSTSICMLPVVRLDGKQVGQGQPGPMFKRLIAAWSELVGVDIVRQAVDFCSREEK